MTEQTASTMASPVSPVHQVSADPYLRLLHVNDSVADQILFQAACRAGQVPFNWHVADSAEKGISYLKTLLEQARKVPVCWPDVVLLDIVMPEVSGFEVLKFIRATADLRNMPVVIFTGHAGNREESIRLGANAFLLKPEEFQEIIEFAKNLYRLIRQMQGGEDSPAPAP